MLAMDAKFLRAAIRALFILLLHPLSPVEAIGHWGPWGPMTPCSVTCGSGTASKERVWIQGPDERPSKTPFTFVQVASCTDETYPECPDAGHWGHWGSWTSCSVTCGSGTIIRERLWIQGPGEPTSEEPYTSTQVLTCKNEAYPECPNAGHWSHWHSWTPCSVTCGSGTTIRQRVWIQGPGEPFSKEPYTSTDVSRCTHEIYPKCPGQFDLDTGSGDIYVEEAQSTEAKLPSPESKDSESSESTAMDLKSRGSVGMSFERNELLTMDLASSGSLATDFKSSTQICNLLIALMSAIISVPVLY